ncbi:hypothetical protein KA977_01645 [Candidatus Dependentiae bacterium]|nr:hypothetical protein [Candidatus Dependentiae bacterium]
MNFSIETSFLNLVDSAWIKPSGGFDIIRAVLSSDYDKKGWNSLTIFPENGSPAYFYDTNGILIMFKKEGFSANCGAIIGIYPEMIAAGISDYFYIAGFSGFNSNVINYGIQINASGITAGSINSSADGKFILTKLSASSSKYGWNSIYFEDVQNNQNNIYFNDTNGILAGYYGNIGGNAVCFFPNYGLGERGETIYIRGYNTSLINYGNFDFLNNFNIAGINLLTINANFWNYTDNSVNYYGSFYLTENIDTKGWVSIYTNNQIFSDSFLVMHKKNDPANNTVIGIWPEIISTGSNYFSDFFIAGFKGFNKFYSGDLNQYLYYKIKIGSWESSVFDFIDKNDYSGGFILTSVDAGNAAPSKKGFNNFEVVLTSSGSSKNFIFVDTQGIIIGYEKNSGYPSILCIYPDYGLGEAGDSVYVRGISVNKSENDVLPFKIGDVTLQQNENISYHKFSDNNYYEYICEFIFSSGFNKKGFQSIKQGANIAFNDDSGYLVMYKKYAASNSVYNDTMILGVYPDLLFSGSVNLNNVFYVSCFSSKNRSASNINIKIYGQTINSLNGSILSASGGFEKILCSQIGVLPEIGNIGFEIDFNNGENTYGSLLNIGYYKNNYGMNDYSFSIFPDYGTGNSGDTIYVYGYFPSHNAPDSSGFSIGGIRLNCQNINYWDSDGSGYGRFYGIFNLTDNIDTKGWNVFYNNSAGIVSETNGYLVMNEKISGNWLDSNRKKIGIYPDRAESLEIMTIYIAGLSGFYNSGINQNSLNIADNNIANNLVYSIMVSPFGVIDYNYAGGYFPRTSISGVNFNNNITGFYDIKLISGMESITFYDTFFISAGPQISITIPENNSDTNSSGLIIRGTLAFTDPGDSIIIYVNSNQVNTITVTDTGNWYSEISLSPGINSVTAKVIDESNRYSESIISINYIVTAGSNVWYVNDTSLTNDIRTTAVGYDTNLGFINTSPFRTITRAIANCSIGDTIFIDAGIYSETIVISIDNISLIGSDSLNAIIDCNDSINVKGIYADTQTGLLIKDIQIKDACYGIEWNNVDYSNIENVFVNSCNLRGINLLNGSDNNIIKNNIIYGNSSIGFNSYFSSNNIIINNLSYSNGWHGFYIVFSDNNRITNNKSSNNNKQGFLIENSNNNYFSQNTSDSNIEYAFYISGTSSSETFVFNNIIPSSINSDSGVLNESAANCNFSYNYWNTTDSSVIYGYIHGSYKDKISWLPFRTSQIDITAGEDTVAPAAPSNFQSVLSNTSVYLSWTIPTSDEQNLFLSGLNGFHIFKCKQSDTNDWYKFMIDTVSLLTLQYVDTNIISGETYYYRITSFDTHIVNGKKYLNESWFSDAVYCAVNQTDSGCNYEFDQPDFIYQIDFMTDSNYIEILKTPHLTLGQSIESNLSNLKYIYLRAFADTLTSSDLFADTFDVTVKLYKTDNFGIIDVQQANSDNLDGCADAGYDSDSFNVINIRMVETAANSGIYTNRDDVKSIVSDNDIPELHTNLVIDQTNYQYHILVAEPVKRHSFNIYNSVLSGNKPPIDIDEPDKYACDTSFIAFPLSPINIDSINIYDSSNYYFILTPSERTAESPFNKLYIKACDNLDYPDTWFGSIYLSNYSNDVLRDEIYIRLNVNPKSQIFQDTSGYAFLSEYGSADLEIRLIETDAASNQYVVDPLNIPTLVTYISPDTPNYTDQTNQLFHILKGDTVEAVAYNKIIQSNVSSKVVLFASASNRHPEVIDLKIMNEEFNEEDTADFSIDKNFYIQVYGNSGRSSELLIDTVPVRITNLRTGENINFYLTETSIASEIYRIDTLKFTYPRLNEEYSLLNDNILMARNGDTIEVVCTGSLNIMGETTFVSLIRQVTDIILPDTHIEIKILNSFNNTDTSSQIITVYGTSLNSQSGDTVFLYNSSVLQSLYHITSANSNWSGTVSLNSPGDSIIAKLLTGSGNNATYDTVAVNYFGFTCVSITFPQNNYDTFSASIIVSGTTFQTHSEDTVQIYVNDILHSEIFVQSAGGIWSGTATLSGYENKIVVKLIDSFDRIFYDTITAYTNTPPTITMSSNSYFTQEDSISFYVVLDSSNIKDSNSYDSFQFLTLSVSDTSKVKVSITYGNSSDTLKFDLISNEYGIDTVYITVTDCYGLSDSIAYTVNITGINDLPIISSVSLPDYAFENEYISADIYGWSDSDIIDNAQYYYEWYRETTGAIELVSYGETDVNQIYYSGIKNIGDTIYIKVWAYDGYETNPLSMRIDFVLIVPEEPPVILLNSFDTLLYNGIKTGLNYINWSAFDPDSSTIQRYSIYYKFNNGEWTLLCEGDSMNAGSWTNGVYTYSDDGLSCTYLWNTQNYNDGIYKLTIKGFDGGIWTETEGITNTSETFYIDNINETPYIYLTDTSVIIYENNDTFELILTDTQIFDYDPSDTFASLNITVTDTDFIEAVVIKSNSVCTISFDAVNIGDADVDTVIISVIDARGLIESVIYEIKYLKNDLPVLIMPPSNLKIQDYGHGNALLSFEKSLSQNVVMYKIYWDSGTGIIDYSSPIGFINRNSDTTDLYNYYLNNLQINIQYNFSVRAADENGIEEKNVNSVSITPQPVESVETELHAYIKHPQAGQKISGNSVNVMADMYSSSDSAIFESTKDYITEIHNNFNNSLMGNPVDYIETSILNSMLYINVYTKEIDPNKVMVNRLIQYNITGQQEYMLSYDRIINGYYCYTKIISQYSQSDSFEILLLGADKKFKTDRVKFITFQMKPTADSVWVDIVPTKTNNSSNNPDNNSPYFVLTDFTVFPDGFYDLRAVATDVDDKIDQSPPQITIEINHADADSKKNVKDDGLPIVAEKVNMGKNNEVSLTAVSTEDNFNNVSGALSVPKNSIDTNAVVQMEVIKPDTEIVKLALGKIDKMRASGILQISFSDTSVKIYDTNPLELTIAYNDLDNNGIIDGTSIKEKDMLIWTYGTNNVWEQLETKSIDTEKNIITGYVKHFSLFTLFGGAAVQDLNNVVVIPNPFVPYDNVSENGIPYQDGNVNSGIIFSGLAVNSHLKIYTVDGRKVVDRELNNSTDVAQWDAKNDQGQEVSSGVYIFVVTAQAGGKKTGKFVIVR